MLFFTPLSQTKARFFYHTSKIKVVNFEGKNTLNYSNCIQPPKPASPPLPPPPSSPFLHQSGGEANC